MLRRAGASLTILVVLLIISLGLAGGGFYLFKKEQTRSMELQGQLDETTTKLKSTEANFDKEKKKSVDLQGQLENSVSQVNALTSALEEEKTARQQALGAIEDLKGSLRNTEQAKADLETKLSKAQEKAKKMEAQLKAMETEKGDLEKKLKDLEARAQVELGNIVIGTEGPVPAGTAKAAPAVKAKAVPAVAKEGKVLVINKDYNFAVINLGSEDGIMVGNVFSVYRNNKYLGDVKVEKVHNTMSAAGFMVESLKNKVQEGDKVVRK